MYYILDADGKTAIPSTSEEYYMWHGRHKHQMMMEGDRVRVSTVFLGLNHNFGDGLPILWETMIFGGEHSEYQERYSTYEEAVEGHARAVKMAHEGSQIKPGESK